MSHVEFNDDSPLSGGGGESQLHQAYQNLLQRSVNSISEMDDWRARDLTELMNHAFTEGGVRELISEVIRLAQVEANIEERFQIAVREKDELATKLAQLEKIRSHEETISTPIDAHQVYLYPGTDHMSKTFDTLTDLMSPSVKPEIRLAAAQAMLQHSKS